jgi:hypothetical protein
MLVYNFQDLDTKIAIVYMDQLSGSVPGEVVESPMQIFGPPPPPVM